MCLEEMRLMDSSSWELYIEILRLVVEEENTAVKNLRLVPSDDGLDIEDKSSVSIKKLAGAIEKTHWDTTPNMSVALLLRR
ncbi:hypothetical protein BGZ90_008654, partial [Linnemannia elongata]